MADSDIASVIETPFDAALSERYLVYALSTITARSRLKCFSTASTE